MIDASAERMKALGKREKEKIVHQGRKNLWVKSPCTTTTKHPARVSYLNATLTLLAEYPDRCWSDISLYQLLLYITKRR